MTTLIGRGLRLEVSKTESLSPKAVTEVSNANPAVATSTAHGMTAGTVGYFRDVSGMSEIEGQPIRVKNPTANGFDLQDFDARLYGDFLSGNFVPITEWVTLARASGLSIGGGDAEKQDDSVLLDDIKKEINGQLAAQTVTIPLKSETYPGEALKIINNAALNQVVLTFRLVMKDGATRIFRGVPSLPGEDITLGAIGTGSISVSVVGRVLATAP